MFIIKFNFRYIHRLEIEKEKQYGRIKFGYLQRKIKLSKGL